MRTTWRPRGEVTCRRSRWPTSGKAGIRGLVEPLQLTAPQPHCLVGAPSTFCTPPGQRGLSALMALCPPQCWSAVNPQQCPEGRALPPPCLDRFPSVWHIAGETAQCNHVSALIQPKQPWPGDSSKGSAARESEPSTLGLGESFKRPGMRHTLGLPVSRPPNPPTAASSFCKPRPGFSCP